MSMAVFILACGRAFQSLRVVFDVLVNVTYLLTVLHRRYVQRFPFLVVFANECLSHPRGTLCPTRFPGSARLWLAWCGVRVEPIVRRISTQSGAGSKPAPTVR